MLGAALHIRADEITKVDAYPWWDDVTPAQPKSEPSVTLVERTTITRAQALYAVLWLGYDAGVVRRWLP